MTFLRWAGSKKQLLETLACCWYAANNNGEERRYIEAFAGSAALHFRIQPKESILIDINEDLQECMRMVKARPRVVHSKLAEIEGTESNYYKIRSVDKAALTSVERSARFIFLNRFCFNGLYRTNKNGAFNVPFGGGAMEGYHRWMRCLLHHVC